MEMGGWQLLWLTVNRILVRHIASGEAHGAWHHGGAMLSCNTPTVPPSNSCWFLCFNLPELHLWVIYEVQWGWLRKQYAHILTPNTWHVPHVFPQNYKEPVCLYKELEILKSTRGCLHHFVNWYKLCGLTTNKNEIELEYQWLFVLTVGQSSK